MNAARPEIASRLRSEGHDVSYVPEFKSGASDVAILLKAFQEKRILLTEDKDFGELVYRLEKRAHGPILLRFEISERGMKWLRLNELLKNFGERLPSNFVTVDAKKFRFRPLRA